MKNENKNIICLKKNIPFIQSSKLLKILNQNNFKNSNLNIIPINNSINSIKRNQKSFINTNNIIFNNNPIRNQLNCKHNSKKLLSTIVNKFTDRNYKKQKLKKNKINLYRTKNILNESNTFFNSHKKFDKFNLNIMNKKLCLDRKINDYNNMQLFNKEFFDKLKTAKNKNKSKGIFKSILLKKNSSTISNNNKNNNSFELNFNNEESNIISSIKNKFCNKNIKENKNRKKVNSLCQTKISIFDINKENDNEKQIICNYSNNNSKLPSLYINKNNLEDYINENNNNIEENILKNNYITINNDSIRRKGISFDAYKSINKFILKKPLNNNKINQKRVIKTNKPVCIVNNFYLCF